VRDALVSSELEPTEALVQRLCYIFTETSAGRGDVLQRQGAEPAQVWVVASGEVRVEMNDSSGGKPSRPREVAVVGRGALIGELIPDATSCSVTFTVRTVSATLLQTTHAELFAKLSDQLDESLARSFSSKLAAWRSRFGPSSAMRSSSSLPVLLAPKSASADATKLEPTKQQRRAAVSSSSSIRGAQSLSAEAVKRHQKVKATGFAPLPVVPLKRSSSTAQSSPAANESRRRELARPQKSASGGALSQGSDASRRPQSTSNPTETPTRVVSSLSLGRWSAQISHSDADFIKTPRHDNTASMGIVQVMPVDRWDRW